MRIFVDLSKPFDTVKHDIVLTKLRNYDIKGNCLKLLKKLFGKQKAVHIYFKQSKILYPEFYIDQFSVFFSFSSMLMISVWPLLC